MLQLRYMKIKFKKSYLAILPLAIVFAVGLILFIGAYSKKDAFSQFTLLGAKETTVESQNLDTDNDGLKDWEEKLYKTDPLNPDTDGDGYLDGEEINSGHNPLVKGPNDKQVFYPLPIGDKYNITDKLLSDFSAVAKSYVAQKDQYVKDHPEITDTPDYMSKVPVTTLNEMFMRAITENDKDWLDQANTLLEQLPEVFQIEISDKDIKISDDSSKEAIKLYFQTLSAYLKSPNFLLSTSSLNSLRDALSVNEFTQVENLIMEADNEIAILNDQLIPSSLLDMDKDALRLIITTRNIFVSLRGSESDPLKAVVAATKFDNVISLWNSLSQKIINLNKSQGLNLDI